MKDDAVEAEISETQEDPTVPEIEQVAQATSRKLLILIGVALYFTPEPGDRKKS